MEIVVATEARLHRGPDGVIRAPSQGRSFEFWTRYLAAFESVRVLARVAESDSNAGWDVEGERVSVHCVPDFRGLTGFALSAGQVRSAIREACQRTEPQAYIARVPGTVGGVLTSVVKKMGKPYALEVVGDPYGAISAISLSPLVARPLSHFSKAQLKRQCRRAGAVSYVTTQTLQAIYPPAEGAVTEAYSSVELPTGAFRVPALAGPVNATPTVVAVGTMDQMYKGQDVLIRALALLESRGLSVKARLVGQGKHHTELEALTNQIGIAHLVEFTGQLGSAGEVQAELDNADLFVMPSRTEGLPRALIEAMARSLPCIASNVGGIPELLSPSDMVPPGDEDQLATLMMSVLTDEQRRASMSRENYKRAQEFHNDALASKRNSYLQQVRTLK